MRKSITSRKGIMSFNFVSMIPRIIFLVLMLMACVILINMFVNNKFNTRDISAEILINGFLYSSGGINQYDPVTGRTSPAVVDISQFNGSELDMAFYYPENNVISAKISLSNDSSPGAEAIRTVYYNKEWYDNWLPLLKLGGIGGLKENMKTLPVIYREEDGSLKSGFVHFQIVQPRAASKKK
jgi:hypothetical protein